MRISKKLINCISKDIKEFRKNKRSLLCISIILSVAIFIQFFSFSLNGLINIVVNKGSVIIRDVSSITQLMDKMFPKSCKESCGIFASDIGVFYLLLVVVISSNLILKELEEKRWVFPTNVGYSKTQLMVSKGVAYSLQFSIPVFIIYIIYYFVCDLWMVQNFTVIAAIINAFCLASSVLFVCLDTLFLSILIKNSFLTMITMLSCTIVSPDIFYLFTFGKLLPTHLLSYTYSSSQNIYEMVIPYLFNVVLCFWLFKIACRKINMIEVNR